MFKLLIHLILFILLLILPGLGQTGGNLFYDIGLMIEDSTSVTSDTNLINMPELSQKEQLLEEELNHYQKILAETEIQLRYQTKIIDSLQTEITLIKAAGETDRALLSNRITRLVDKQDKASRQPDFVSGETQISGRVFAELETPWQDASVTVRVEPQVMAGPSLSLAEEQAAYRKGLTQFHQQYYYQAIEEFNTIVDRGSDVTLRANAQYWVGRCYFEKGLYDEAIRALEQVQRFKYSDKRDDALVLIGLAFKRKDRLPEAKLAFQELVLRHPGSEYLTLAKRFVQK